MDLRGRQGGGVGGGEGQVQAQLDGHADGAADEMEAGAIAAAASLVERHESQGLDGGERGMLVVVQQTTGLGEEGMAEGGIIDRVGLDVDGVDEATAAGQEGVEEDGAAVLGSTLAHVT